MKKMWPMVLIAFLAVVHLDADARRLGGGRSIGKQSGNVTQREAVRPATPAASGQQNAASQAAPAKPAAAPNAAAAAPKKPWGAMLGGLAAGLGLAWLASSLGLGAEFGQFLLIALLVLVGMAVLRMVLRSRQQPARAGAAPFAFQGAGGNAPAEAQMPRQYNPEKIGNDASARPWEQFSATETGGSMIGSALGGSQNWGVPAGFDTQGFLEAAKRNYLTLQGAWDRADIDTLRSMMTDGLLSEVREQLREREAAGHGQPNVTRVEALEAQLLGIEELGDAYMASVEFSGMVMEDASSGLNPFREVWNMTKARDGRSGWLVAGLQALQ